MAQRHQQPNLVIFDMCARRERDVGQFFAFSDDQFWRMLENAGIFDVPGPLNPDSVGALWDLERVDFQFFYGPDAVYRGIREIPYQDTMLAFENFNRYVREARPRLILFVGKHIPQFIYGRRSEYMQVGPHHLPGGQEIYVVNNTVQAAFGRGQERLQQEFNDFAAYYLGLEE